MQQNTGQSVKQGGRSTCINRKRSYIQYIYKSHIESTSGKLNPLSQIHPPACACISQELRKIFAFLNDWKKSKEKYYFVTHENL